MVISIAVNGPTRFHHCVQFRSANSKAIFVEARKNSEIFLLLANRESSAKSVRLIPHNLGLFGVSEINIPFDSYVHLRIRVIDPSEHARIKIIDGQSETLFVLGSQLQLRAEGINVSTAKWYYPNPFPNDGPRPDIINIGSEEWLQQQFAGLVNVSKFDVDGAKIYTAGRMNSRATSESGYVYLISHPIYYDWVKIGSTVDLTKRLSSYQTSDPLRRYELERFYDVDDRLAVEKWLLHYFAQKHSVQGEWVNCSTTDAIRLADEALDMIKIGEK